MARSEEFKILNKAYELGFKYEKFNKNCAQCTFAAVLDALNVDYDEKTFKATTGLGGGGGLTGSGSCGGFSGGAMAIGYMLGRGLEGFRNLKAKPDECLRALVLVKKLHDKFIESYGSILCCDVQKKMFGRTFQMIKREGDKIIMTMDEFENAGAHADKGCPVVVGMAARWTVEILLRDITKNEL
ncbi:MAG: C-GCAxxG-C-C family protein [Candidatus Bathyarchaeia archaeon]